MKRVKVRTVEQYFALPKEQRQTKWGWYLQPTALECFLPYTAGDSILSSWELWSKRIRQEYPIQGWVREWLLSYDNPLYAHIAFTKMRCEEFYYNAKRFFCPAYKRFAKAYKRWVYRDIDTILLETSFALILDFYDETISSDAVFVNWTASEHKDFYIALQQAVQYINVDRKSINKEIDDIYTETMSNKLTQEELSKKYDHVRDREVKIQQRDTETLVWFVTNRSQFWT
jgi:hypothetical protein